MTSALLAVPGPKAGDRPCLQVEGANVRSPCLVLSGDKGVLASHSLAIRSLANLDILVDSRVRVLTGPGGGIAPASSRVGPGEASLGWALVAAGGKVMAEGEGIPDEEQIKAALAAARIPNPVAVLHAFLEAHPRHAEARRDLLEAFRPRLAHGLALEAQDLDLDPETDARIWGPVEGALEDLLREDMWALMTQDLGRLLQIEGLPEKRSHLMKGLYHRHRDRLRDGILRFPEHPAAWANLLRMNQVLERRDLAPLLQEVDWSWSSLHDTALVPSLTICDALFADARTTGDWRFAGDGMRAIWQSLMRRKCLFLGKGSLGADPESSAEWSLRERMEVWERLLEPWIEAEVRGAFPNLEQAGPLAGLDESWRGLGLESRLGRLARRLERPDLGQRWIEGTRNLRPCLPAEGMGQPVTILYQGLIPGPVNADQLSLRFLERGVEVGIMACPKPWLDRMRWSPDACRWALVNDRLEILASGENPESIWEDFLRLRWQTPLERVEGFLRDHPDHTGAMAFLARIQGRIAQRRAYPRLSGAHGVRGRPDESEMAAWESYAQTISRLLEGQGGFLPAALARADIHLLRPEDMGRAESFNSMATRFLPALERALESRPSDLCLWRLWIELAAQVKRPVLPLLEALYLSPCMDAEAWPPQEVLLLAVEELRRQARWQDVVRLLQPRVRAYPRGAPTIGEFTVKAGVNWEYVRPCLEALLKLGRDEQVRDALESLRIQNALPAPKELEYLIESASGGLRRP